MRGSQPKTTYPTIECSEKDYLKHKHWGGDWSIAMFRKVRQLLYVHVDSNYTLQVYNINVVALSVGDNVYHTNFAYMLTCLNVSLYWISTSSQVGVSQPIVLAQVIEAAKHFDTGRQLKSYMMTTCSIFLESIRTGREGRAPVVREN